MARADAGKLLFDRVITAADRTGTEYNDTSCRACHDSPSEPGSGDIKHLTPQGFHKNGGPAIPANAAMHLPPPLYGLGLLDELSFSQIAATCGAGGYLPEASGGTAPFGLKPIAPTLEEFVAAAAYNELGLTNFGDLMGHLGQPDGGAPPDISLDDINTLTYYIASVAPPTPTGPSPAGEAVFEHIACTTCHEKRGGWYSDLCVHDMGAALGEVDPLADNYKPGEYRTGLLWGLRFRKALLHDGRASTIEESITLHGGQAADSVAQFGKLSASDRASLLAFLNTL